MKTLLTFTLILGLITFTCQPHPPAVSQKNLSIAYIGNMGILLEYQDQTVLIDGLHEEYGPDYAYPAEHVRQQLIAGTYPGYSTIELLLYTHLHGDHFSASQASAFLRTNPQSRIFAPPQVVEQIAAEGYATGSTTIPYDQRRHTFQHHEIQVQGFQLDHGYAQRHRTVQNIAFIIQLGPYRAMHLGDTDWERAEEILSAYSLASEQLDLAFIPYWLLANENGQSKLDRILGDAQLVATHISPRITTAELKEMKTQHPDVWFLTRQGETVYWPAK